jgi:hypothetical protein
MAVTMVSTSAKVKMFFDNTIGDVTKTELGGLYGVSRKTVARSIKEVRAFLNSLSVGQTLNYQGGKVVIDYIEEDIRDDMPIRIRSANSMRTWENDLADLMDSNPVVAKAISTVEVVPTKLVEGRIPVGSQVFIAESSQFYLGTSWNPRGVIGTVEADDGDSNLEYGVEWSNGHNNTYSLRDLVLASDVTEKKEDEGSDYFVVAPQDSITIIRVCKESGEVESRNINKHSTGFSDIRAMIVASQDKPTLQEAFTLMDIKGAIEAFSIGRVKVDPEGETVVFVKSDGSERKVPEDLAADIIGTIKEHGRDESEKLVKFLDALMDNSSFKAIEGLYRFMKHNCIEINEDGSIQAWKGVMDNMYSSHGGSIKSSPTIQVNENGQVYNGGFGLEIRVDRSEVDDDPDSTCSHGLHVGNKDYASSWASTLISVSVKPQDVVAVPKDYSGAKMRTCGYTPIRKEEK